MAWANYDDVLDQLRGAGLILPAGPLQVGTTRSVRCKVEDGDREKRGWYWLRELSLPGGDVVLVGSFGVFRGNDCGLQKVDLKKRDKALDVDQRNALRRQWAEDRKRADALLREDQARAADKAADVWGQLSEDGASDYLDAKKVGGFGLRYDPHGSAVVPVTDTAGRLWGLQYLRSADQARRLNRPAKEFFPAGIAKRGHFHLLGSPSWVVLVAEGYATAASLHMATGHPVAVAFDAGNLLPVAEALAQRYRGTRVLVCADEDVLGKCQAKDPESGQRCGAHVALLLHGPTCPACGSPHGFTNAGATGASTAAMAVKGAWLAPAFVDREAIARAWADGGARKLTDFNDLHVAEALHVVRVQVEAKLAELRWSAPQPAASSTPGDGGKLRVIQSVGELLDRYVYVYAHQATVFDRREHCLLSLSDMRDFCIRKDIHRAWMESADRPVVRIEEVGFDPAGTDAGITCNLWGGWPTEPRAGECSQLLALLRYLCSDERNGADLYTWVLRWLAYPLQHPGAKMKTTLVAHGPQGTGKNLFFETYMAIFGRYGRIIGQDAIEDKFNDWASRKLFLIADEVVARSDLFHVKNKLKSLITGDWIRINPKNVGAYDERNHVNLVFLSNEAMPVVLEEDDRRHCVIWTPAPQPPEFYKGVMAEIAGGGMAALYDYLLGVDLADFHPGTRPPETAAKAELVGLGLDSPLRFWDDVMLGEVGELRPVPALAVDWFEAYKRWCHQHGHRPAPAPKFINALQRKRDTASVRKRYTVASTERGPHAFLLMGNTQPPADKPEREWLGDCVHAFREALAKYRGGVAA